MDSTTPQPKRVLIIEDDADLRTNLEVILTMEGFEVWSAADGVEGVRRASQQPPDVILCDVNMPGLDGYGVLQQLRENRALGIIPFIFLTARGARNDLRAGMNLGADDYLIKPATRDELMAAIQSRLDRHRALQDSTLERAESKPDFSSAEPLKTLGLTARECEVLLWIAQGKSNSEISLILGMSEKTVKIHVGHIFEKMGADNRHAVAIRALELLNVVRSRRSE